MDSSDKKDRWKAAYPYYLDKGMCPKKVPVRFGPKSQSGNAIKPLYEDQEYISMPLDDIMIQNKSWNYVDERNAKEFDAPNLQYLPMLLRKCWQKEKQGVKTKDRNGAGKADEQSQSGSSTNSFNSSNSGPPPKIPRNE